MDRQSRIGTALPKGSKQNPEEKTRRSGLFFWIFIQSMYFNSNLQSVLLVSGTSAGLSFYGL
jgi:hypothetical protein